MVELSEGLRLALEAAMADAHHRRHDMSGTEHLLLALLHDPETAKVLKRLGANIKAMERQLEAFLKDEIPALPDDQDAAPEPSLGFREVLQRAVFNAETSERRRVAGPHVLIAYFNLKHCYSVYLLEAEGISRLDLMQAVSPGADDEDEDEDEDDEDELPERFREDDEEDDEDEEEDEDDEDEGPRRKKRTGFGAYTLHLNREAAEGRIDPMVGREAELTRAIHILCRRRKNNPVFVGEAGVGKTAIVEGLALAIHEGRVPEPLAKVQIYTLDVGSLVAGTRYRGDFEARLKKVVKALEKMPEAILFVDEIHTLIGAGSASGGALDASTILKPALARGRVRCIGATTWKEYRGVFERDHALARRFQKVEVGEPTVEETRLILEGLKGQYESFHHVTLPSETLSKAAELSGRHLKDRFLPDKAIDVVDEASAEVKLAGRAVVEPVDVERTLARMASIPSTQVERSDRERLGALEGELKGVVFGQDKAVEALTAAIKMSRSGLSHPDKPIGAFLFTGPTGVGKTEVARQLGMVLGLELIRFDMSEYMERHTVSRLIGAPPGYVGFEQGGLLTDAVAKKPHSVVLLDEIEKAHPDVFNLLLQVMDHGTLTDNNGKKTDFRNVVLIMTSNVGARELEKGRAGFAPRLLETPKASGDEERAYKQLFSPEFRNRLDARIQFAPLSPEVTLQIAEKFLKQLGAQLAARGVVLEIREGAKRRLAERGFDPKFGARPMDRVIRDHIKRPLADELLFGRLAEGGRLTLDAGKDDALFAFEFDACALMPA